jgi:predicted P-loop ATPase
MNATDERKAQFRRKFDATPDEPPVRRKAKSAPRQRSNLAKALRMMRGDQALAGIFAYRNQLFAEAVALYRQGRRWWPDDQFELIHIAPEQESRFERDAWEEAIIEWLGDREVLIKEVAKGALQIDVPRLGRAEQNRIVAILERLGWRRKPKDWRGNTPWQPPAPTTDDGRHG